MTGAVMTGGTATAKEHPGAGEAGRALPGASAGSLALPSLTSMLRENKSLLFRATWTLVVCHGCPGKWLHMSSVFRAFFLRKSARLAAAGPELKEVAGQQPEIVPQDDIGGQG